MPLKHSVRPIGLRPELLLAVQEARAVYRHMGYEFTITSITDSEHSRKSLHYAGAAFDIRTRHMTEDEQREAVERIAGALTGEYDVVREETHIHLEWQPKQPYST